MLPFDVDMKLNLSMSHKHNLSSQNFLPYFFVQPEGISFSFSGGHLLDWRVPDLLGTEKRSTMTPPAPWKPPILVSCVQVGLETSRVHAVPILATV